MLITKTGFSRALPPGHAIQWGRTEAGVVRGGAMTVAESDLWTPARLVVIRFPSMERAEAFYRSAEYGEVLKIGRAAAERTVVIVEGL